MFNCAVSLAGDCTDIQGVKRLCALADLLVAADAGADILIKAGIAPDWVIGDNDSAQMTLPDQTIQLFFPRDKDYTDGELAVSLALFLAETGKDFNSKETILSAFSEKGHDQFAQCLTENFRQAQGISDLSFLILFPFGRRLDHSWTNILLAASLARSGAVLYLSDGLSLVRIIAGSVQQQAAFAEEVLAASILSEETELAFSAIPLDDNVKGFTLSGLKWNLEQAELPYNRAAAVSNRPLRGEKANPIISLENGTVMLVLTPAD